MELLEKFVNAGDCIVVGVSGGADSMCLFNMLSNYRKKLDFQLIVVHVNHNIRGQEALRDQEFVIKYAKQLGEKVVVKSVDAPKYAKEMGKTLEEAARELRYEALKQVAKENNAKLFVAHNKGDQAETILMHIARGSSMSGAVGMLRSGQVYRPLLNTSKREIINYNEKNNVPYVEDSTNNDNSYSRNFMRNEVLPLLKTKYLSIEDALVRFSKSCERDDLFIEKMLPNNAIVKKENGVLLVNEVRDLDPAISIRLIKRALNQIGVFSDVEENHYESVLSLFSKKSGSKLNLPHGVVVHHDYEGLFFEREEKQIARVRENFALKKFTFFGSNYEVKKIDKPLKYEKNQQYFDLDKVKSAVFRTVEKDDRFAKLGSKGSKKIGRYLIDKKIEKRNRDKIIVLAVGNEVLLVVGLDLGEKVKIDENTKNFATIIKL